MSFIKLSLMPNRKVCITSVCANGVMVDICSSVIATFSIVVYVVLVNSLDRLGRDWGMTKQYIDLLTEHKVKLLCVRERMMIDSSSFSPFFT